MKKSLTLLLAGFLVGRVAATEANAPAILPKPQNMKLLRGEFQLTPRTRIYTDRVSRKTGRFLAAQLRPPTGLPLGTHLKFFSSSPVPNAIFLTVKKADPKLGPEGYALTVTTNAVVIRAPRQAGLFYGAETLRQLLPPEIFSTEVVAGVDWQMPCVQIRDWPRFKWRGLMLDVSRHFYNTAEVERVLDLMALFKLNRFHWHLTDFQGWRIEIPKYPRLTRIGAWRKHWRIEPLSAKGANAHSPWLKPSPDKFGPDGQYGGYYTPQDVRAVVAYAAARHITVVPEIEMPGHSGAALRAYPQYLCRGTNGTRASNIGVYCVANDQTYVFLENVLKEVFKLFPGKYVHIGGDEVNPSEWEHSPRCQSLMKAQGMTNVMQLQSYFIKRIEKFVHAHGKTLIGWSEILKGGLAPNAVVMDWIGGAKQAATEGHDVVRTPTGYCYFDYYQSTNHPAEPQAGGGYLPLRRVYAFDPIPQGLPPQDDARILGGQANLWTEYVVSLPQVEYMLFPRLCALAEAVWSPKDARQWPGFERRLKVTEERLRKLDVNYRGNPAYPLQ